MLSPLPTAPGWLMIQSPGRSLPTRRQDPGLQPLVGPSVGSLCHLSFTATNLSYRFPIFETSATALRGTTGINLSVYLCIHFYLSIYLSVYLSFLLVFLLARSQILIGTICSLPCYTGKLLGASNMEAHKSSASTSSFDANEDPGHPLPAIGQSSQYRSGWKIETLSRLFWVSQKCRVESK